MNRKEPKIKTEFTNGGNNDNNDWGQTSKDRPIFPTRNKGFPNNGESECPYGCPCRKCSTYYQGKVSQKLGPDPNYRWRRPVVRPTPDESKKRSHNSCGNTSYKKWCNQIGLTQIQQNYTKLKYQRNGGNDNQVSKAQNREQTNDGQRISPPNVFHQQNSGNQNPIHLSAKQKKKKWMNNSKNMRKQMTETKTNKNKWKRRRNWRANEQGNNPGNQAGQKEMPKSQSNESSDGQPSRPNEDITQKSISYIQISDSSSADDMSDKESHQKDSKSALEKSKSAVCAQYMQSCSELSRKLFIYHLTDEELMASFKYAILYECDGDVETAAHKIYFASKQIRLGAAYSIEHPKDPINCQIMDRQCNRNASTSATSLPSNGKPEEDNEIMEVKYNPTSSRRSHKI